MTDFKTVIQLFGAAGIECVIVGGLAATIHGSARLTQDVDFVYARTPTNIDRLVDALRPHAPYPRGAPPGLPFDWSRATIERGLNFRLTTAIGDIDRLGEISGGGNYEALLRHSTQVEMFGCRCRCAWACRPSSGPSARPGARRTSTPSPSWKCYSRSTATLPTGESRRVL